MANQEQLEILRESIPRWNRWRLENLYTQVDLRQADLRRMYLKRADLRRADLRKAQLAGADLQDADLRGAQLAGADLRKANLRGANLGGADLTGANLLKADLSGAFLEGAILRGAQLSEPHGTRREPPTTSAGPKEVQVGGSTSPGEVVVVERPPHSSRGATSAPPAEEVFFTALYPREGSVSTWYSLLVYAHLSSALEDVNRDARRFLDQLGTPKTVTSASPARIARGTEITIVPACEGIVFNPERKSIKWLEDYQRADFRFRADPALADDAAKGEISIYVGPVLVGTLKFAMLFSEATKVSAPLKVEQGSMYHQEEIFISYSHKDTNVVLACKKAYEALGFNVLIDVDDLRAGQVWNDELMNMIDRSSIFQLFWSQNSSQSKYCRQEWEHALRHKKEGFIRPVYWEKPIPDPPDELSKYHFEFMEVEAPPATRG